MTACRPIPLKTLGCEGDGDGEGSFFAISNELHGSCHTALQIQAVTMKIMMLFLLPLVMAMTVVLVAAAAAVTMIVYMLALVTTGLGT